MSASLRALADEIHANAAEKGFWEGDRNFGEQIALMHSELSEALEEHRARRPSEWFQIDGRAVRRPSRYDPPETVAGADWVALDDPDVTWTGVPAKPEGAAVELADCLIRILDTMAHLGVDIDGVVARKMDYNAAREHKHGRAY